MVKILLLLALTVISFNAKAEVFLKTIGFKGQPMMLLSDGEISSCGVRFVTMQTQINTSDPKELLWFADVSFSVDRRFYGLLKAGLAKVTVNVSSKSDIVGKPKYQEFKTFWLKAPNSKITEPINGKLIDADDLNYKLYGSDIEPVTSLYNSVLQNESIQLGFKFNDGIKDFAFYGKVEIDEQEREQLKQCLSELGNLMQKDLSKEE